MVHPSLIKAFLKASWKVSRAGMEGPRSAGSRSFFCRCFLVRLAQRAAEGDAALVQIVGGDRHGDDVAGQDADEVFAHLAGNMRDDLVSVVELDAELRVGKGLHHFALNEKWFFFGHTRSSSIRSR